MMTMKRNVMASLLIGGMLVGNAHALGGFNPVSSIVDTVVDTAVDAGGEFLNAAGVDNDCDGSSVADHFCQGLGGADAVNDGISTGIQVAGDAYLGGGSAWDAALDYGQEYLEDAAYDYAHDYAHDNYGDYYGDYYNTYNSLSDGYDTYLDGDIYDAALDRGQGYVHDNYADDYYGDYYNTYNSLSDSYDTYNDQYQDLADDYDYYGDNYGRKLLKA